VPVRNRFEQISKEVLFRQGDVKGLRGRRLAGDGGVMLQTTLSVRQLAVHLDGGGVVRVRSGFFGLSFKGIEEREKGKRVESVSKRSHPSGSLQY